MPGPLAEFTAALHYGPGPHPDGSPQAVHAGGHDPLTGGADLQRKARSPRAAKANAGADDRAWLESVLVGASPKETPGVIKGIVRFLKERYPGATLADIRQMYAYNDTESGLSAEIDIVQAIGTNGSATWVSGLSISGIVRDQAGTGEVVGSFERILNDRGNVVHEKFVIQERFRGQGFGARFYRNSEDVYRRIGVKAVLLQANMSVGGYAWARMGFDFGNANEQKQMLRHARLLWQNHQNDVGGNAPFPEGIEHAWDIAALTAPDGERIGKLTLLRQSWYGTKRLAAGEEGVKVGELYYAEKDKKRRAN